MNFLKNINFLTKTQYEGIANPSDDELWAIETPAVIEEVTNGTDGYRLWSNGYCEQWGRTAAVNANASSVVNLLKTFSNLNYWVSITPNAVQTNGGQGIISVTNLTTTDFTVCNGQDSTISFFWQTGGYIGE